VITTSRGVAQGWVLDNLLALGGIDVLHPQIAGFFQEHGYARSDVIEAFKNVHSAAMIPKGWGELGEALERKATSYRSHGYDDASANLFMRASMAFARAQYSYFGDDPRRAGFAARARRCVDALSQINPTPIERVEAPFEGRKVITHLHLAAGAEPAPLVLLLPGMDMVKEEWIHVAQRHFVAQGFHAVAIEGPGQGETLTNGLKVTVDNYERAVSAVIDTLIERREIDPDRIVLWGVSMGAYWGLRTAAHERRLKAAGTTVGFYGDVSTLFKRAQPNFKRNFMYMAGYDDEDRFDREFVPKMALVDVVGDITCPVLMGFGEFDELSGVSDALKVFERIKAPKDLLHWEGEFHPLGGVMAEAIGAGRSWLKQALDGKLAKDRDFRAYIRRDGSMDVGTALPSWWPRIGGEG